MNSKWRKVALVGASLLAAFSLSACGNKSNSEPTKTKDGKTIVTYWTFTQVHTKYWQQAAKLWNKEHPKQQIKLKTTVLPFAQENEKLTTALQGGSGAPDIVDIELGQAAIQLKNKKPPYLPLNKELAPYKDKLIQSRLDNYKKDGKYYGLDYHVGTVVTYYNTDLLKKAGVNYKNIKTWKQYTDAGKQVKAKTGKYMTWYSPNANFQWYAQISQQHADMFNKSFTKPNVNNPAAVRALQMGQDWIYKDKIARKSPGGNIDNDQAYAQFNKGNVASVTMPAWYMSRMVSFMPKLKGKIAIAPMPVFEKGNRTSADGGGTATMVTNQTPKASQSLVKKFVVFGKANKTMAGKQWSLLGFDPIRKDVWTSPVVKEDNQYTRYFGKGIFDVLVKLQDQTGHVTTTNKRSPALNDYLLRYTLPNVIGKGKPTAKVALNQAQKALTKQFKTQN
ncbi:MULTISPECIES: ABC transporter substrate-binding protein [Lactobacillus]|uniref:Extracellular solute-binding protein n=1 Tax=Lactobacillus xujianguonis TaxID=2495899 RepID=A0A437SUY7_9LACO|nr:MULTISPECIES: extracellular solute-binding protein [Lactobacillus]RVU70759.1 extracellular solute-binding protein [Lactobacillus xujianguonis]RVU73978.1 extracellular solute-binding protein [Lactobacillus xujianguonis]